MNITNYTDLINMTNTTLELVLKVQNKVNVIYSIILAIILAVSSGVFLYNGLSLYLNRRSSKKSNSIRQDNDLENQIIASRIDTIAIKINEQK